MNWRLLAPGLALSMTFMCQASYAFDLTGAWATNPTVCKDIFATGPAGALMIKEGSDFYGSGFIVRGKDIIGKLAKCTIISTKQSKNVVRMAAACSTDVALGHVQFAFKIENDNKITRIYPGLEELNVSYSRCSFN